MRSAARSRRFAASDEVTLFYADSSALVKLVRDEPESKALRAFIGDASLVSSEIVLTEIPRAVHRAVALDPNLPPRILLHRVTELLEALALSPIERTLLIAAGALSEPLLRALDAIHIVSAVDLSPVDGFVSYDERQSAAARLAGLRTFAPGA
jgi:uncharacterized protein